FMNYLTQIPQSYQLIWTGKVEAVQDDTRDEVLTFAPGDATLAVISGDEFPEIVSSTEALLASSSAPMLERTRRHWAEFTRERNDFEARIKPGVRDRDLLLQTVDDVSVLIAAQQSSNGGVIAGHNYHWYGIRDQNGVGRTLLYLGESQRARGIYDNYW